MSTIKADNFTWKTGQATGQAGTNVTGDQIVYGVAKSWCNWNGSSTAVRASLNISSVTRNGTGNLTFNFTNSLLDANFSATTGSGSYNAYCSVLNIMGTYNTVYTPTSSSFRGAINSQSNVAYDEPYILVSVNR